MANELFESADGTADANGRAEATLQPLRAFETWKVKRLTVQSTSSTLVPTCRVYRGAVSPSRLIDGTYTGTLDHTDTDISMHNGERLIAVWEGADVASVCTLSIEGDIQR